MSLTGKYALITGSSRGIGRGTALRLAEKGVNIAINYRQNEAAALDTLAKVRERGADGFVIQADVSKPEEISRLFGRVQSEFGHLDIFVANALGDLFSVLAPPLAATPDQLIMAAASQGQAFLLGVQAAASIMPDGGRIVAVTYSPGGNKGSWQPYISQGTAKAALESLVRYFAVALAKRRITVNAISPGLTEDSIISALPPVAQEMIQQWCERGWVPMGRMGKPEDIGNAIAMLCSAEASWITGQTIAADGGASLMNADFPLEIQMG
ncbi:MAG: SDR family oxidoreductase [Caldilineaceae bacterium]